MSLAEYGYVITTKSQDEQWAANEYKMIYSGTGPGTFSRDSSQAQVVYICEYDTHDQFLDVVMGKTVKVGATLSRSASSPNFGSTQGSMPEEHPFYFNFFASSASVEGKGNTENANWGEFTYAKFPKAIVTVVFRPPPYSILPDGDVASELERFVVKIPEGTAEFQSTQGFFKFVNDSDPNDRRTLDLTPGMSVASTRYTYTWLQIPVVNLPNGEPDLSRPPNWDTVLNLAGSLNSVDFDGYAPGTVLFVVPQTKLVLPQCATDGGYFFDIPYVLAVRDYGVSSTPKVSGEHMGFNYSYDPQHAAYRLFTTDGTTSGNPLYPYADLNQLFEVSW